MKEKIPCCMADALQRIRKIEAGGLTVGIAMLDEVIREVQTLDLPTEPGIRDELLKRVKLNNYIPKSAEDAYAAALLREYRSALEKGSENRG
jgi:hypothetical protein